MFEPTCVLLRTTANFSKSVMVSVAALTLGRSHLVFVDPYFIPPTHPTNVAWDSLHHGLVCGRLALPSCSTLYDHQDSNLGCPEAIMWEEWSRACLFLACRWFLRLGGLVDPQAGLEYISGRIFRLSRKIAADGGLTKIRPADSLNSAKDNIYSQCWLF